MRIQPHVQHLTESVSISTRPRSSANMLTASAITRSLRGNNLAHELKRVEHGSALNRTRMESRTTALCLSAFLGAGLRKPQRQVKYNKYQLTYCYLVQKRRAKYQRHSTTVELSSARRMRYVVGRRKVSVQLCHSNACAEVSNSRSCSVGSPFSRYKKDMPLLPKLRKSVPCLFCY